jgi:two-component system cell cycle sensor histidine kinase/response regulator CckA
MEENKAQVIQGIIDSLPFYVLLIDTDHRIVAANREFLQVFGLERAEILGGFCPKVVHDLEGPYPGCPLEEAVRTGQDVVETEMFDAASERWLRSSVFRTELKHDGQPVFLHTIRDITAQKQDEEERRKLEEQLLLAQKLDSVGRLAGGIAHDFNNLLTLILNYAGFTAAELEEDHPLRENVERIRRAGKRAAALTRQLLAFSRQEVVKPRVVDVNEVVTDIDRLLRRTIGENIDLKVSLDRGGARTKIDPGQLEQVLVNLVVNARDAMPAGGRLTVSTRLVVDGEAAGPQVQLVVSDTGVGMTEEVRAHLFEPFFTTKERGKGTGLGLATVYGIVTRTGGRVQVDTQPGRGTTFTITLPATDEPLEEEGTPDPADLRGRGETILVVDDDGGVLTLVERILTGAGYRVLQARDGSAALLRAQQHAGEIDLLLTDVVLRGMSGKDLAGLLGQLRPGTRVLLMSGYPDADVATGAGFLAKPFTEEALLLSVREALDAALPVDAPPPRADRDHHPSL